MSAKIVSKVVGTKLTPIEVKKVNSLIDAGAFLSVSDFLRDAVRDKLEAIQIINLRDVDYDTAKRLVFSYFEKNKEAYLSDAANNLKLDLELVHKITEELKHEGWLGEAE